MTPMQHPIPIKQGDAVEHHRTERQARAIEIDGNWLHLTDDKTTWWDRVADWRRTACLTMHP